MRLRPLALAVQFAHPRIRADRAPNSPLPIVLARLVSAMLIGLAGCRESHSGAKLRVQRREPLA